MESSITYLAHKYNKFLLIGLIVFGFLPSCKKSDAVTLPEFSAIRVYPQKQTYQVGDTVYCYITQLSEGSTALKKATYWFYANWWFTDPEMTADFQEFTLNAETGKMEATSNEIVITDAAAQKAAKDGSVDLCFYGRLEYPNWDFRKVEIRVPINVK